MKKYYRRTNFLWRATGSHQRAKLLDNYVEVSVQQHSPNKDASGMKFTLLCTAPKRDDLPGAIMASGHTLAKAVTKAAKALDRVSKQPGSVPTL